MSLERYHTKFHEIKILQKHVIRKFRRKDMDALRF